MDETIAFQQLILKLKSLKRTGWVKRKIENPESVADHSFSVAVLAMQISDQLKMDTEKCIRMALLHEIAETKIGDIIPSDEKYKIKPKLEKEAVKEIIKETGSDFFTAYLDEYDENKTKEAKLIHDLDKIEMCMQAKEYQEETKKDLTEFYDYTKDKLQIEECRVLLKKLLES